VEAGGFVGDRIVGLAGDPRGGVGVGGENIGNNHVTGQAVAPQLGPNPADTQREIDRD